VRGYVSAVLAHPQGDVGCMAKLGNELVVCEVMMRMIWQGRFKCLATS
jgi:hypothetical protein